MLPQKPSQRQLGLLHDLARMMDSPGDPRPALEKALALMAAELGMMRGAITLLAPDTGRIQIHASFGLNAAQIKRGSYLPGEGITGRVIASGEPMCIADVANEPLFLNRTRSRDLSRDRISFLCVPIKINGQVVGALSADQLHTESEMLEDELRLLRIIAAILAHAAFESRISMETAADSRPRPAGFVGNSGAMLQVYDQILVVAPSLTTVFLQGESGTGKELAARAIHAASQRAEGPFISLNCAALPETLIESELFGHEKGAFTGAVQTRKGRFEQAAGGTLFLDEVGELSPLVQAKLLRVLQERAFERVGGMQTLRTDARVITATNRDLAQMVSDGVFRRDLFYRLNVFPILLPPLRDRREDIPALAARFLERLARENGRPAPTLGLDALDLLQRYSWPGNIRELQNTLERAMLLLGHDLTILPEHLPKDMRDYDAADSPARSNAAFLDLRARLDEVERSAIISAMKQCGGNQKKAAEMLDMTERIMGLRLKKFGLDYRDFRKKK